LVVIYQSSGQRIDLILKRPAGDFGTDISNNVGYVTLQKSEHLLHRDEILQESNFIEAQHKVFCPKTS